VVVSLEGGHLDRDTQTLRVTVVKEGGWIVLGIGCVMKTDNAKLASARDSCLFPLFRVWSFPAEETVVTS